MQKVGMDLPTLMRTIHRQHPHYTANMMSQAISEHLGEKYAVRCVRYLSKISDVSLEPDPGPIQKRGRGWLQKIIVEYLEDFMHLNKIKSIDYDHTLYMLVYCYPPDYFNIGDLVRAIGIKKGMNRNGIRNMYLALAPDLEIEKFFDNGSTHISRVALNRMENNTKCARESLKGRRILSVLGVNDNTTLLIFDDGTGVLIRPDTKLGNVMRLESPERVQSHLQSCVEQKSQTVEEASDLLKQLGQ